VSFQNKNIFKKDLAAFVFFLKANEAKS